MNETQVSIGQVKRDISELVNRVAYGRERIVLTSRGKPKAALISLDDYKYLQLFQAKEERDHWEKWLSGVEELGREIVADRSGKPIDMDELWAEVLADREKRDDRNLGN